MGFIKKLLVPLVIFAAVGLLTILLFNSFINGEAVIMYPLIAGLGCVLYFWQYQLTKGKKSGIFYIYLSVIVAFIYIHSLVMSALYANASLDWTTFLGLYWIVVGLAVLGILFLKLMYRGLNDSIKNQSKGEHGLSKMQELAKETMFILDQYKKDASEAIKVLKEVDEALEYSDPVSHKSVYPLERQIVSGLKTGLRHAKNKHFGKIKAVMKDSNGVLFLIEKRNRTLIDNK
ncbi:hypothetical protein KQ51_00754 [Candidatus Izimaplasma bacterium HR1]|jgi:hypothetical protein|uniref:hypothetical protein n=1 Tax=Candidatus Izimoplasma sp. HR1 TaxID=1541959 RepID=UPI0004F5E3C5|nr:hypothetical protein KQ51_00754 [Candidatus Izimaplasma bacterium HR1]